MEQSQIVDIIINTINTIFSNIFSSIDNNIYENLDSIVFINPDLLSNSIFSKLLGSDGKAGLIYLTDAMLVGIFIFYIVKYFYSNMLDITYERPTHFIFKLLIFGLLVNFSYFFIDQILSISFLISSSIQEIGKNVVNSDISFSQLIIYINKNLSIDNNSFNVFSFDGIIKSFVSFGLINLLLTYSIRYVLLQVLILFSPFAILCLINSSTSWIFKAWSKTLFSLIAIQFFIPLLIIVIFCIDYNNKVLFVGGIYSLMKINNFVREMFGGISIEASGSFTNVVSMLRKQ